MYTAGLGFAININREYLLNSVCVLYLCMVGQKVSGGRKLL